MALIINKVKSFKWTVDYEYPDDDDFVEIKFKAIFKRMPQKFLNKMAKLATPKKDKDGNELPTDFDPSELCREVVIGWEEVFIVNEKGEEEDVPFNKENLNQIY